jgi:glycosyltransferase involved in cell wall biosynthesis
MPKKLRIVHVINSFECGGAEAMLCNVLLRTDRDRFDPSVVSLIDDLTVAGPVLAAGIPLLTMGMKPGLPDPRGVVRLAEHLRRLRPDVIQTWMDHSNLIGGLTARTIPHARLVWGIHHSNHLPGIARRSTLMTVAACAALSHHLPARIVCCSEHSSRTYAKNGFAAEKLVVIPNGFDTELFKPDPAARVTLRRELNIPPQAPVIGLAARYDPFKDHSTFLRAAGILTATNPDVHLLLCGNNVHGANATLLSQIESLGLSTRCRLLGARHDMPRIYAAMDVNTSSSISEAFPLAVGEAMACGVPCVVTDVGDSALIVGDTGRVVPPREPAALASAWAEVLAMSADARSVLGLRARARIRAMFSLDAVVARYHELYETLVRPRRTAARADHFAYA